MPWTGTPVVKLVSDKIVRVTGVSLGALQRGIITTLPESLPDDIGLPEAWQPTPYSEADDVIVTISDAVKVWWVPTVPGNAQVLPMICITKTDIPGPGHEFQVLFENFTHLGGDAGPEMEIYLEYH